MSHDWPRFLVILFPLLLLYPVACKHIPDVDRHFQRSASLETVRYFRYAIDASQFDAAYHCLTDSTREQLSALAFQAMIRFVDVPQLGGLGLTDLLVCSDIDGIEEVPAGGGSDRWVTLIWHSEDQYIEYSLRLQPGSAGLWQIDLFATRGVDLTGSP
ncbi:MAG: hypothetical protein OSB09_01335 [Planctomycetota bacterium]|nr:hypothetical protein [Planctomycetota bacterium]